MMKFLSFLVLMLSTGQYVATVPATSSVTCTPPSNTYRWAAFNSANLCGTTGGSSCTTNGQAMYKLTEINGNTGHNAEQATTTAQPTYTTNAINSLPAATFNGTSDDFPLVTSIPNTVTTYSFYAVVNPAAAGSYRGIVGGGLSWDFNTTNNLDLRISGSTDIATGTNAYSTTGTWLTLAVTYNNSTNAYAFYVCSAGTCTVDKSGTGAAVSLTSGISSLGTFGTHYFNGSIAEIGYYNGIFSSTDLTNLGAYSQCEYNH